MADLNTIREQGFRLLVEGLGTADAVNFLRHTESGTGNYTEDREKLHEGVTIDEIVTRIQKHKEQAKE